MKRVAEEQAAAVEASGPKAPAAFVAALLGWRYAGRAPVIAEIKLASPKHGPLLARSHVADRVAAYEAGGAACVSVVTGRWYGGDLDLLRQVRGLTARPVLRKDFITCRRAVDESREAGADAVLLTKRLLSAETLASLASYALSRGITPFVEVADGHELRQVALPDGAVLAVNNRDIRNREVGDQGVECSLALQRTAAGCRPAAWVSASGIEGPADIGALVAAGFDAALVATALLRSDDAEGFLRAARQRALRARPACASGGFPRNGTGREVPARDAGMHQLSPNGATIE